MRNNIGYIRIALRDTAPISAFVFSVALVLVVAGRLSIGGGWAPGLAALISVLAYFVVYVELRHIVPFILVIAVLVIASLAAHHARWTRIVVTAAAIAALTESAARLWRQQRPEAAITLHELRGDPRPEQASVIVARALAAAGLKPGDRVATVNALWNVDWAQRAGLVVRAYVPEYTYPNAQAFADLMDPCVRAGFEQVLRVARIRAVVLRDTTGSAAPPWLSPIGETGYRLHMIGPAAPLAAGCPPTATRSSS